MSDIERWLEQNGLAKYAAAFLENELTPGDLPDLTEADLRELGLPMGPRKRLMRLARSMDAADRVPSPAPPAVAQRCADVLSPPEAEHRQLTVMFCDLVGSVGLGERMDVEDYRDLLARFRTAVADVVKRYGGFVARHQGDGMLVYFGYPQAHEDDAERAIRAGLGIVESVKCLEHPYDVNPQVRVGIATGPTVVGDVLSTGASERSELAALGQTPNFAARLQSRAEPDTVVVSETTHALTAGLFDVQPLPVRALKGISRRVVSYVVRDELRGETRFATRSRASLSPFVGREEETELLARRWRRAVRAQGQVALIFGEAGIGKSRLVQQLRGDIENEAYDYLPTQCSPHHDSSTLHPVIAAFERALDLGVGENCNSALEKLRRHLDAFGAMDEKTIGLLAHFLSLPVEGEFPDIEAMPAPQRRDRTLAALVEYVHRRAKCQPVLCVFEDVHWTDPSTKELLSRLVESIEDQRVFVVVTSRPGFEAGWTDLPHVRTMMLSRLALQQGQQLARAVSSAMPVLSDAAIESIVSRAGGNPLFIEELTRAVADRRTQSSTGLTIPETLRDSLMARLDASEAAKSVAQCASVIGRTFDLSLLSAVWTGMAEQLAEGLRSLESAGLLVRRGEGELTQFSFRHTLVRDTAYESLLRQNRAPIHARVAAALEAGNPGMKSNKPELLARHHAHAGLAESAVELWLAAARRSVSRSANAETIAHFEAAMSILDATPEVSDRDRFKLDLLLVVGPALMNARGSASPEVRQTYLQALELANRLGNLEQKFAATWGLWLHYQISGEFERARQQADKVVQIGGQLPDSTYLLQGHHAAWTTEDYVGNHASSLEHANQGVALYQIDRHRQSMAMYGDHDPGVCAHIHRALGSWYLGYPDRAATAARASIDLAGSLRHPLSMALSLTNMAMLHQLRGEPDKALEYANQLISVSEEHDLAAWKLNGHILFGWARGVAGDEAGLQAMDANLKQREATGSLHRQVYYLTLHAELLNRLAPADKALAVIDRAALMLEQAGERRWEPHVHAVKGDVLRACGDEAAAETHYMKALDSARGHGAVSFELTAAVRLAALWRDQGKAPDSTRLLAPIYGRFTEGFEAPYLVEARRMLDALP